VSIIIGIEGCEIIIDSPSGYRCLATLVYESPICSICPLGQHLIRGNANHYTIDSQGLFSYTRFAEKEFFINNSIRKAHIS